MARVGKWEVYAQHECLLLIGPIHSRDYVLPAMQFKTCPRCGQPCDLLHRDTWAKVVRRRISDGVWYRPSTWGDHHWEYKLTGHLDARDTYRMSMWNAKQAGQ
jgi:transposase